MTNERAGTTDPDGALLELWNRVEQLLGWAKVGQTPPYPARPEYYVMDAENVDRLCADIVRVVRELRLVLSYEEGGLQVGTGE